MAYTRRRDDPFGPCLLYHYACISWQESPRSDLCKYLSMVRVKVTAVRYDGKRLEIEIEDELLELLKKEPFEYRVSTDCVGS